MRDDIPPVATSRHSRSQALFSAGCRRVSILGIGFCRARGQRLKKILRITHPLTSSTTKPSQATGIRCGTSRFWPSLSRNGINRWHEPRKVWFIGPMFSLSFRQFQFAALGIVLLTIAIRLPALLHPLPIDDEAGYSVIANEIVDGGRPYIDAVDRKPPLLFWTYAAVFKVAARAIGVRGAPLRRLSVQTASGDCSRTARHLFAPSELSDQPRIDTHPVYHPGRHSHDRIFWSCSSFRSRAPGTRHPPRDDLLDNPRPYHSVHLLEKGNLVHAGFRWGMLTASGGRGAGDSRSSGNLGG